MRARNEKQSNFHAKAFINKISNHTINNILDIFIKHIYNVSGIFVRHTHILKIICWWTFLNYSYSMEPDWGNKTRYALFIERKSHALSVFDLYSRLKLNVFLIVILELYIRSHSFLFPILIDCYFCCQNLENT